MLLLVFNIEFQLNYSLMLLSLTSEYCFNINIKYMHAGMIYCLAAAAVSRGQKDGKTWEELGQYIKGLQRRLAVSAVEITLIVVLNLLQGKIQI